MIGCHSGAVSEAENLGGAKCTLVLPDLGLGLLCCEDGIPSRDATEATYIVACPPYLFFVLFMLG